MIQLPNVQNKYFAVFGLGETGLTSCAALTESGASVCAWDDREDARQAAAKLGVKITDLTTEDLTAFEAMIVAPGIPLYGPKTPLLIKQAKTAGLELISDMELFARGVAATPIKDRPIIIAITGTNGKSTTASLIAHILHEAGRDTQLGGNIGKGVLSLDPVYARAHYVFELSSYQLEITPSLQADIAILLNISADHLDRHGSMENYVSAKNQIFANQTAENTRIIGIDDKYCRQLCSQYMAEQNGPHILPISVHSFGSRGIHALGSQIHVADDQGGMIHDLKNHLHLKGAHNAQNVCAAVGACLNAGLDRFEISKGIESFNGLPHRLQTIALVGGLAFVNDSKATNTPATEHALGAFENIYWIAGGQAKGDDLTPLLQHTSSIQHAYFIGEAAPGFENFFAGHFPISTPAHIAEAVRQAWEDAQRGGHTKAAILLSPACASFDQFRNFEQRGDHFVDAVRDLIGLLPAPEATETADHGSGGRVA